MKAWLLIVSLFSAVVSAHGGEDHAEPTLPMVGSDASQRLPDGQVRLSKAMQLGLGLRTARLQLEQARPAIELSARVIADPSVSGVVSAVQDGVLIAPNTGLPRLGQQVEAGQLLGYLQPADSTLDRGNQQAQSAALSAELAVLDDTIRRLTQVGDYNSRNQLEQATIRRQGLVKQLKAVQQSVQRAIPLLAPTAGVLSETSTGQVTQAGQFFSAGAVLFQIIEPSRLWLESQWTLPSAPEAPQGFLLDGPQQPLTLIGSGRVLRGQSLPIYFEAPPERAWLVGQLLSVLVQHGAPQTGLVIPRSALVRGADGQWQVWLKTAPETFAPISVSFLPLDSERVLVPQQPASLVHAEGQDTDDHQHLAAATALTAGQLLVVQAASLLNQVR